MTNFFLFFFIPLVFCTNDYQLIRLWMRDVAADGEQGVTDDSLFLSVELDKPKFMSPDWRYAVNDIVEKQSSRKPAKNDDDFQIYGNRHKNQQLFRFYPESGLIHSERYPNVALNIIDEFMELVNKNSITPNWKWKIKESVFESLYELRHSNFEIEHILIDHVNPNPNIKNNTHATVSDISPNVNEITESLNPTKNSLPTILQEKTNTLENQLIKEQKLSESSTPKKKNTTIWIFISVIVILIIIAIFVKIGCFPNYTVVESSNQTHDLEETLGENVNS